MNIEAAKAVADAIRTSLGPRGMDKMVRPGAAAAAAPAAAASLCACQAAAVWACLARHPAAAAAMGAGNSSSSAAAPAAMRGLDPRRHPANRCQPPSARASPPVPTQNRWRKRMAR